MVMTTPLLFRRRNNGFMAGFILCVSLAPLACAVGAMAGQGETSADKNPLSLAFSAGGSFNTGNTKTSELGASIAMKYRHEKSVSELGSKYQYRQESGDTEQNRVELELKELYKTANLYDLFLSESFAWDEIQKVDYDNNIGFGARRQLALTNVTKAYLDASLLYQSLKLSGETENKNVSLALESKVESNHGAAGFSAKMYYQVNLSDDEDYKLNGQIKTELKLSRSWGVSASVNGRYRNITTDDTVRLDTTSLIELTLKY